MFSRRTMLLYAVSGALFINSSCSHTGRGEAQSGVLAREVPVDEELRATPLKLEICQSIARQGSESPTDRQCLEKEYRVTKKYFSGEGERTLSMMDIQTTAVFREGLDSCTLQLKRSFGHRTVDDQGDFIEYPPSWYADNINCQGLAAYSLAEEEKARFDLEMGEYAELYASNYAGHFEIRDECSVEAERIEFRGEADPEVNLSEGSGSGQVYLTCVPPGAGEERIVEYCSIEFDLTDSNRIDLGSIDVVYCDY